MMGLKHHTPAAIAEDKVTYENTVEIVDALAGHKLNADQEDYLEILSEMVAAYEDEHLPALPTASTARAAEVPAR